MRNGIGFNWKIREKFSLFPFAKKTHTNFCWKHKLFARPQYGKIELDEIYVAVSPHFGLPERITHSQRKQNKQLKRENSIEKLCDAKISQRVIKIARV